MKIRPIFVWYDFWIGLFWDGKKRCLYFFPVPMLGMIFDFRRRVRTMCPKCKSEKSLEMVVEGSGSGSGEFGTTYWAQGQAKCLERKCRYSSWHSEVAP